MKPLSLSVDSVVVRQKERLYRLNDLHKAAGGEKRHQPSDWLKTQAASGLVEELSSTDSVSSSVEIIKGKGKNPGTYVCKALLLHYAAWISPLIFIEVAKKFEDFNEIIKALESFEIPEDMPDMFVYAIRETESGRIKIGISKHPEKRLQQLQLCNGQRLELVAVKQAVNRYKDEQDEHAVNHPYWLHTEWFDRSAFLTGSVMEESAA